MIRRSIRYPTTEPVLEVEQESETVGMDTAVDRDDWPDEMMEGLGVGHQGRPFKYRRAYDKVARNMKLLGYTNPEIAEVFGIKVVTLQLWRNQHPSFAEAWHEGGPMALAKVARAMYRSAVGYSHEAVQIFNDKDVGLVYAPYTKHYPPDVSAGKFLLVNRAPDLWKNVSSTQLSGPNGADLKLAPSINVLVVQNPKAPPTIEHDSGAAS